MRKRKTWIARNGQAVDSIPRAIALAVRMGWKRGYSGSNSNDRKIRTTTKQPSAASLGGKKRSATTVPKVVPPQKKALKPSKKEQRTPPSQAFTKDVQRYIQARFKLRHRRRFRTEHTVGSNDFDFVWWHKFISWEETPAKEKHTNLVANKRKALL